MPSSGAPATTGRSELPGSTMPASSRDRCRYSQACRSGPTAASMPSPSSVAKRPCGTAITPSSAARATCRGWTTAKCSMRCLGSGRGYWVSASA